MQRLLEESMADLLQPGSSHRNPPPCDLQRWFEAAILTQPADSHILRCEKQQHGDRVRKVKRKLHAGKVMKLTFLFAAMVRHKYRRRAEFGHQSLKLGLGWRSEAGRGLLYSRHELSHTCHTQH
jgi:hypothetical protein